jgi:hypothetical protein
MPQITDDGIAVLTNKTDKPVIYEWTPELTKAIEDAEATKPRIDSAWLFCTKNGKGYLNEKTGEAPGWKSM